MYKISVYVRIKEADVFFLFLLSLPTSFLSYAHMHKHWTVSGECMHGWSGGEGHETVTMQRNVESLSCNGNNN